MSNPKKPKISLFHKNTKVPVKGIGIFELKGITIGDAQYFSCLLYGSVEDRDFLLKVLFHQLVKPEISLSRFSLLDDTQLDVLMKALMKMEQGIFKNYQNTGKLYSDFRSALRLYQEEQIDRMMNSVKPFLDSHYSTLEALQIQYSKALQPILDASKAINELQDSFVPIVMQSREIYESLQAPIQKMLDQYANYTKIFSDSVLPQIALLQDWVGKHQEIFGLLDGKWEELLEQHKIEEKKAAKILRKYKWFISPNLSVDMIAEAVNLGSKKGVRKAINQLFYDYFYKNNWRNFAAFIEVWGKRPLGKKRIHIFRSVLNTLQQLDGKVNVCNVVIPTLISQIDGLLSDYLDAKNIPYKAPYDDYIDKKTGKTFKKGRKSQFKENSSVGLTSELDQLAEYIILDIFFQRSIPRESLQLEFNFNRHKIMHGENVNYGKKDYLIRCILVLDLLISID